jgi:hypothetical protein
VHKQFYREAIIVDLALRIKSPDVAIRHSQRIDSVRTAACNSGHDEVGRPWRNVLATSEIDAPVGPYTDDDAGSDPPQHYNITTSAIDL